MNGSFLDLIPKGKDSARGCKELAAVTGMTEKQIRATVSRLRLEGAVICSSLDNTGGGYFLPETLEELREYIGIENARIRTAAEALRAAENELKRRSGYGNNNR